MLGPEERTRYSRYGTLAPFLDWMVRDSESFRVHLTGEAHSAEANVAADIVALLRSVPVRPEIVTSVVAFTLSALMSCVDPEVREVPLPTSIQLITPTVPPASPSVEKSALPLSPDTPFRFKSGTRNSKAICAGLKLTGSFNCKGRPAPMTFQFESNSLFPYPAAGTTVPAATLEREYPEVCRVPSVLPVQTPGWLADRLASPSSKADEAW